MKRFKTRLLRSAVAAGIVLCAIAGPAGAGTLPDVGRLVDAFDVVAFGSETKALKNRSVLLRWDTDEIAVNMTQFMADGEKAPKPSAAQSFWTGFAWKHLKNLQNLTGLRFVDSIAAKKRPRLTIIYTARRFLAKVPIPGVDAKLQQELAAPGGCYFLSFTGAKTGQLDRAFIVVNTDRGEAMIDHCLLEELTQSLGLPNDTDLVRPSIFSDHDTLRALSVTDEILVRTLYHPRLHAGMERKAAMVVARLVIAQQLAARR